MRFLEQARAEAPDFAWPALQLADTYAVGKRVDKKKAGEELAAFFAICPSSADQRAQVLLSRVGSAELKARVAAALRARLAQETDQSGWRRTKLCGVWNSGRIRLKSTTPSASRWQPISGGSNRSIRGRTPSGWFF
jgi:hypothetical protein